AQCGPVALPVLVVHRAGEQLKDVVGAVDLVGVGVLGTGRRIQGHPLEDLRGVSLDGDVGELGVGDALGLYLGRHLGPGRVGQDGGWGRRGRPHYLIGAVLVGSERPRDALNDCPDEQDGDEGGNRPPPKSPPMKGPAPPPGSHPRLLSGGRRGSGCGAASRYRLRVIPRGLDRRAVTPSSPVRLASRKNSRLPGDAVPYSEETNSASHCSTASRTPSTVDAALTTSCGELRS